MFSRIGVALLTLTASALAAEPATSPSNAQAVRERLSPTLQSLLTENCGEDCPGFRLEPRFKAAKSDSMEDLGFTRSAGDSPPAELASLEATVLVEDAVPESSRESLKQVLAQRLANEAGVPVTVTLKALSSVVPAVAKRLEAEKAAMRSPVLAYVKDLAWPASLVFVALLALAGLTLAFRGRRELLRERERLATERADRKNAAAAGPAHDGARLRLESEALGLLETRAADLSWFLRERASAGDRAGLKRVLGLFSAPELSRRLALDPDALRALASLPGDEGASIIDDRDATLGWLERELDRSHWRRLEEEHNPLLLVSRWPDAKLQGFFGMLQTESERAVFLADVSRRRWPALLGGLGAEDRIALGIALDRLQAEPSTGIGARAKVAAHIARVREGERVATRMDRSLLEDYSLTLPEKEGQALWAAVRGVEEGRVKLGASAEGLLETLNGEELTELCMKLDLKHLRALLANAKPAVRARMLSALPDKLRERVAIPTGRSAVPSQTELFAARADLMAAYRAFAQAEELSH